MMWKYIHRYGSPQVFYDVSLPLSRWFGGACIILFMVGLYGGLVMAPADYQQGHAFRIIYIHVPSAWLSLFIYVLMAVSGGIGLIWHIKIGEIISRSCAPIGASFTFLTLVTGSIWGKPMWGTYWDWDPRLISYLILWFLYLGFMALQSAFEDRRVGARAGAILALVGMVNIPIIHYSVEWWNTLHQGPTISKWGAPSIDIQMLIPLLLMALAFKAYFVAILLIRSRSEILQYECNSSWVQHLIAGNIK